MGSINSERINLINRRVGRVVTKGVLQRTNDATKIQQVQFIGRLGKAYDAKKRYQDYGRTSVVPNGSELLFVQVGGDAGHLAVIAIEDERYRPQNLQDGEQVLYTQEDVEAPAAGNVIFTGVDGTKIPAQTPCLRNGDNFPFETGAEAVIEGGTATVGVKALIPGELGNTPASTALSTPFGTATVDGSGLSGGREDAGHRISMLKGRIIQFDCAQMVWNVPEITINATTKITLNTPLVEVPAGDVVASGISLVNHIHAGDSGGLTGPPQ